MMNVLVIGGSGYIGKHIVDNLIHKKVNVTVLDVSKPLNSKVDFVKGNIRSLKDLVGAMGDIDFVYHLAGQSNINRVMDDPVLTVDLNILGTANVLEVARKSDVKRVVFASSYFVQSGQGHIYSTTKLASEMLCRDFFKLYHLPFTILRYGTVYGPESRNEDVISIFVKRALHHQPLVIHGDGNQTRNFIFVDDAAEGSVAVLQEKAKNKTYYLEGSEQVSINKVVTLIKEILGDVKIEYQKARYDDFKGKALSTEFNLNELNWEPRIDFKEGLTRYIAWYMKKNKITSKRY